MSAPAQCALPAARVQNAAQTPMFADANFVDVCPLETDPPSDDLYNGSGADTGVTQAEWDVAPFSGMVATIPPALPGILTPAKECPAASTSR